MASSNDSDKRPSPLTAAQLRRLAEQILQAGTDAVTTETLPVAVNDAARLIHELQIQQLELSLQNQELRRAQDELQNSRDRYFQLYELSPLGYLTVDDQGSIIEANLGAANLLVTRKTDLYHQRLSRFIAPEDQDGYELFFRQRLSDGDRRFAELRLLRPDNTPLWRRLDTTTIQLEGIPRLFVMISDISERVKSRLIIIH